MYRQRVSHEIGRTGEVRVAAWLRKSGVAAKLQPKHGSFYDINCSGIRVEVKTANRRRVYKQFDWTFTTHRQRRVNKECDIFILRLQRVPKHGDVHLVIPAPIKQMSVNISEHALAAKWLSFKDNLAPLLAAIEQKRTA